MKQFHKQIRPSVRCVELLELDLCNLAGIDTEDDEPTERPVYLSAPVDSPWLQYVGTACGRVGNRVFADADLIYFLKEAKVEYVIGVTIPAMFDGRPSIALCSVVLPLQGENADKFAAMVENLGGSFRRDNASVKGWNGYESE